MFQNKMVTPAIPERVYTLCKIVEKKAMSSSEVKEKMEPSYLNQKSSYYNDYRNAAEELQLITVAVKCGIYIKPCLIYVLILFLIIK